MEETNVAAGTTSTNSAQIAASVHKLDMLFDDIETTFHPALLRVAEAQNAGTWTSIPACNDFRAAMQTSLNEARARLDALWGQVSTLCTNLQESAAALAEIDTTTSDALTALMTRADAGPPAAPQPTAAPPYRPGGPTTTPDHVPPTPPSTGGSSTLVASAGILTDAPSPDSQGRATS